MVGANASGKSNFVDALRFLQGCARSLTLGEIFSGKREGGQLVWMPIRGGEQESFGILEKAKRFELEMHWELPNLEKTYNGNYCLEIGFCETKIAVLKESFAVADEEYIGPDVPEVGEDICANLFALEIFTVKQKKIQEGVKIFRPWLREFHFLDLAPSLMRDYVPKNRPEIGIHGENLSAALFKLASNPEQHRTVLDWIQELCPQEIVDFDFIETKLGDVLLAVKEPKGVTISARSMSDGTLRFLAIIVAMLTAKEGTTFIVEEIDNDLHPSRLHLLVNFLEQVTMSRKLQVIASTHSPYFLDHLSESSLKNVLVFHRDQQSAETKVTKLIDIPGFTEARKNMPLDLMHASSWMEQNL
jgi:predicted ATPase